MHKQPGINYLRNIFCIVMLLRSFCLGQALVDSTKVHPLLSIVNDATGDFWHIAGAPLNVSKKGALKLSIFALINTGFIYGVDGPVDKSFGLKGDENYWQPTKPLVRIGEWYDQIGTAKSSLGISAGLVAGGLIFKDNKLAHTGRLVIESLVISTTFVYLSKRLIGRSRPYAEAGPRTFTPVKFRNSEHDIRALPSGHTSSAFSLVTVVAKQYPQWWIKYPAYTAGVSVALQRMEDRQHWLSDVVIGGSIGYWVANTLVNRYQKNTKKMQATPYISSSQIGIQIFF